MKSASQHPAWLERRGFSATTKARIAISLARNSRKPIRAGIVLSDGNVVAFSRHDAAAEAPVRDDHASSEPGVEHRRPG